MTLSKTFWTNLDSGLATVVVVLMVTLQILRVLAFSAVPADAVQAIGCAGIGIGYLLILPSIKYGNGRILALMFFHLGLFGIAQLLAPNGAAWLGGFAAATQCIITAIVLRNSRQHNTASL